MSLEGCDHLFDAMSGERHEWGQARVGLRSDLTLSLDRLGTFISIIWSRPIIRSRSWPCSLEDLVKMQIASGLPRDEPRSVTMSLALRFFGVVR
jgi:hypothetical protein